MGKYDGLNDRELISLLQQGDEGALRPIYDTYIRQLHYFILRTAKSKQLAEDVVQDVFIKVWDNRMQIDREQPFKPYQYTIAKRHLLNLLKGFSMKLISWKKYGTIPLRLKIPLIWRLIFKRAMSQSPKPLINCPVNAEKFF